MAGGRRFFKTATLRGRGGAGIFSTVRLGLDRQDHQQFFTEEVPMVRGELREAGVHTGVHLRTFNR